MPRRRAGCRRPRGRRTTSWDDEAWMWWEVVGRSTFFRQRGRSLDLHALPERDAALDVGRRVGGLRVVPDGLGIHLAVDEQRVVVRLALPRAARAVVAERDVVAVQAR